MCRNCSWTATELKEKADISCFVTDRLMSYGRLLIEKLIFSYVVKDANLRVHYNETRNSQNEFSPAK